MQKIEFLHVIGVQSGHLLCKIGGFRPSRPRNPYLPSQLHPTCTRKGASTLKLVSLAIYIDSKPRLPLFSVSFFNIDFIYFVEDVRFFIGQLPCRRVQRMYAAGTSIE